MSNENIVIFGCGISGSVCALKLLKEGIDVVVIEKSKRIGSHTNTKIDITEDAGLRPIINDLNLNFLDELDKSIWISRNERFDFRSEIHDLFVKRGPKDDSFEVRNSERIRDLGGSIKTGSKLKKFEITSQGIHSIETVTGGKKESIEADFFVDGTASNLKLPESIDIYKSLNRKYEIIGYGLVSDNLNVKESETRIFLDSELAPGGYFFLGKAKNGLGVASLVSTRNKIPGSMERYFNRFVESKEEISGILSDANIINYFCGSRVAGFLDDRTCKNFCAIGDSAYLMDPLFGYGVRPAILSGYLAAKEIIKCLEQSCSSLSDYDKKIESHLLSEYGGMNIIRKTLDGITNRELDFIIKSANNINEKVHLDGILKNPSKISLHLFNSILKSPLLSSKIGIKIMMNLLNH